MINFRNLQQVFTGGGGLLGQRAAPQPTMQPNLRNSAGVFADYMRQNMVKKTPNFMPPPMGNVGVPTVPTGPIMGGGDGLTNGIWDGGGSDGGGFDSPAGGGGGLFGGRASFGADGMTAGQRGTGMSDKAASALAGLLGGLLGIPGLGFAGRGMNGYLNTKATDANASRASQMDSNPGLNGLISDMASVAPGRVDASYLDVGPGYGGEADGGGYGGGLGHGADGSGTAGTSDAGDGGSDGTDGGNGGGWAKGGMVTKKRLRGKNPPGPDDGYGALDAGEAVISKRMVKKHPRLVAGLLRG